MMKNRKIMMSMVAAALAASTGLAYAQPQGSTAANCPPGQNCTQDGARAGGPRHGMRDHDGRGGERHHGRWSNPKAAVEGYLASLKVELKITPNQEQAWQAFAGKARAQADTMNARREKFREQMKTKGEAKQPLPAPERLAQATERMKQRVASMETMTVAVRDLYSVLTPEQKAIADKQLARGAMGHRGHGGRSHHRNS